SMELSERALRAKPVSQSAVPNYFVCKACKGLLVNCFQTPQGFRLCQVCVNSLHPTHCGPCPGTTDQDNDSNVDGERQRWVCRDRCLPDLATRRELSELWVFCPNADLGCSEQMQWKMLEEHLKQKCEYETVACQFCLREIIVYKLHLVHCNLESADCCVHFRCHCGYCGFFGYGSDMLNRVDFIEHAKTCSEIPVKCPFAEFGCRARSKQRQLTEHYSQNTNEHLLMMSNIVKELQASKCSDAAKITRLEKENGDLKARIKLIEAKQAKSEASVSATKPELRRSLETITNRVSANNVSELGRESSTPASVAALPSKGCHRRVQSSPFSTNWLPSRKRTASESLTEETNAELAVPGGN
ncbi:hypothetical protein BOX15_Mlig031668g5, partial [Macrostomum lignano]